MAITWRVPVLVLLGLAVLPLRPEPSTAWAWVGLTALLVGVDALLAPSPRAVQVRRPEVGRARLGEATSTTLQLKHAGPGRRVRGVLRDAWQPSAGARDNRHRFDLAPGKQQDVRTALRPTRRGNLRTALVTVRTLGPLGLAGRQGGLDAPGVLRVLPAFPARRHLPSRLARLRELDGRAAVRVRGQGTEFDSLREYVEGDDVRSVDWRASARSRSIVVRTWQPERDRRVFLALDTGRTSAGRIGDVPRLDAAMDAALLLTALASRAGDHVGLIAGDTVIRTRLRPGHRQEAVEDVQQALADLQPVLAETDWRRLVAAIGSLGRQRALVVLLSPLEPAAVHSGLVPLIGPLTAHHHVVVASVRDPEIDRLAGERGDARSVYAAAAAEQASAQRDRTARLLGALGVEVLDADAEQLPVRLADHYLSLKAQGRL